MTTTPDPRRPGSARVWFRRAWPWIKYLGGIGLAALALWALAGRRGELSGASAYLDRLDWPWVVLAAVSEFASLVAFGLMQQRLLAAGGVRTSVAQVTGITLATTAIANSIPAGPIVSSVFAFRQYRRRGADEALAGWVVGGVFVGASVSLAVIAAIGLAVAGAEGAGLDLVGVTVGVLVAAVIVGVLFVNHRFMTWAITGALRVSRRIAKWPRGHLGGHVDRIVARLTAVSIGPFDASAALGWASANWVLDCACLALCFQAVGAGVPWKGLLLAYGAAQLAVNLPVTPGGLGVVEGSLTIALVAFGGAEVSTVAVVLLYRIMSFWGELPIGWGTWAATVWATRREQARRAAATEHPDEMAEVMA